MNRKFALLLLILLLITIIGCTGEKAHISYDFETYLSEDTIFEQKASIVLPSKKQYQVRP